MGGMPSPMVKSRRCQLEQVSCCLRFFSMVCDIRNARPQRKAFCGFLIAGGIALGVLTNDEGWYRGQCRFSRLAPAWGEFYEVRGDLLLDFVPDPEEFRSHGVQLEPRPLRWVTIGEPGVTSRHFLFYLRDQTFECDATDWSFSVVWTAQL